MPAMYFIITDVGSKLYQSIFQSYWDKIVEISDYSFTAIVG